MHRLAIGIEREQEPVPHPAAIRVERGGERGAGCYNPPVISNVTPADTSRHLRRRANAIAAQGKERARHLRSRLPAAVRCLRQEHGIATVVLFGSLANRTCRAGSDVDLAVRGLPADHYFEALADLMEIFAGPVDLVRLEDAPRSLRERIDAEGEPL